MSGLQLLNSACSAYRNAHYDDAISSGEESRRAYQQELSGSVASAPVKRAKIEISPATTAGVWLNISYATHVIISAHLKKLNHRPNNSDQYEMASAQLKKIAAEFSDLNQQLAQVIEADLTPTQKNQLKKLKSDIATNHESFIKLPALLHWNYGATQLNNCKLSAPTSILSILKFKETLFNAIDYLKQAAEKVSPEEKTNYYGAIFPLINAHMESVKEILSDKDYAHSTELSLILIKGYEEIFMASLTHESYSTQNQQALLHALEHLKKLAKLYLGSGEMPAYERCYRQIIELLNTYEKNNEHAAPIPKLKSYWQDAARALNNDAPLDAKEMCLLYRASTIYENLIHEALIVLINAGQKKETVGQMLIVTFANQLIAPHWLNQLSTKQQLQFQQHALKLLFMALRLGLENDALKQSYNELSAQINQGNTPNNNALTFNIPTQGALGNIHHIGAIITKCINSLQQASPLNIKIYDYLLDILHTLAQHETLNGVNALTQTSHQLQTKRPLWVMMSEPKDLNKDKKLFFESESSVHKALSK